MRDLSHESVFVDTIKGSDLRKQLEVLRDLLADRLVNAPAREQAPIAAQLRQVLLDLNGLPMPKEGSKLDDLATRRAARRANAANASSA